jgi:hypothetical protein
LANFLHSYATLQIGVKSTSESERDSDSDSDRARGSDRDSGSGSGVDYQRMYNLLIGECVQRIAGRQLKPQTIANMSWSLAKLSPHLHLQHSLWFETFLPYLLSPDSNGVATRGRFDSSPSVSLLSRFLPQEYSNLVWSVAQLYHEFPPSQQPTYSLVHRFLQLMADTILSRPQQVADFKGQELANTALSYADLRRLHRPLMTSIAARILQPKVLNELNAQVCPMSTIHSIHHQLAPKLKKSSISRGRWLERINSIIPYKHDL